MWGWRVHVDLRGVVSLIASQAGEPTRTRAVAAFVEEREASARTAEAVAQQCRAEAAAAKGLWLGDEGGEG
jgi:hypothetical protein